MEQRVKRDRRVERQTERERESGQDGLIDERKFVDAYLGMSRN